MDKTKSAEIIATLNKVNKLNKLTILLIIVVSIALVGTIGALLNMGHDYRVEEKKNTSFGQEVTYSTVIYNQLSSTTENDEKIIKNKYYVYTMSDAKHATNKYQAKYDLTLKSGNGNYVYFDRMTNQVPYVSEYRNRLSVESATSSTSSIKYSNNIEELSKNGIETIFGNVKYWDSEKVLHSYKYSKDTLSLSKKDIKNASGDNLLKEVFNLQFFITSIEKNNYATYTMYIDGIDFKVDYTLDAQAFVETPLGIYPLVGFYNYSDNDTKLTTEGNYSVSDNRIFESLDVKNVYVKVRLYSSAKDYQEAIVKYDYATLLANKRDK